MSVEWVEFNDGQIKLALGDCLSVLPTLAPGSVDAVVTDPPYLNLTGGYSYSDLGGVAKRINDSISVGDEWGANLDWANDAIRVARLGVIVFCTHHGLPETAMAFASLRRAVLWSWHKRNAPVPGANVPRFTEEYAWGFAKRPGLKWDAIKSTLIDIPKLATGCCANRERLMDDSGMALHPAQKPLAVMFRLLDVVPEGFTVLDPFAGSFTTAIACMRTGRKCIAIERDQKYFELGVRRIEAELNRHPLFDEPKPKQRELSIA